LIKRLFLLNAWIFDACADSRCSLELGDDLLDDAILHGLVVRRDVAAGIGAYRVIEIELADFERILADGIGNLLDHAFGPDHALRAAKAAKRRIGYGVGVERR
jgi:hypothetical protein